MTNIKNRNYAKVKWVSRPLVGNIGEMYSMWIFGNILNLT